MEFMTLPTIHLTIERWKKCVDADCYVSSEGRLKDLEGNIIPVYAEDGYIRYGRMLVHRMVMKTFKPLEDYTNMTVDHINHNTRDNRLCNLRWLTKEENEKLAQPPETEEVINSTSVVWLDGYAMTLTEADKIIRKSKCFKREYGNPNTNQQNRFKKYRNTLTRLSQKEPYYTKIYGYMISNNKEFKDVKL